ncbi:hypothetical protein [Orientia tsutsugamushi]|uniref:hypothetical protein n=1 Tax=Orientia tsutsugamushi TaxID=784 RepID=UPI000D5A305F|nr:replicative DNA helicase [Orientia tsutsugamushi]
MPEIKLNLRPNLLRLFRYLSAIILNYLNQFRKKSIVIDYRLPLHHTFGAITFTIWFRLECFAAYALLRRYLQQYKTRYMVNLASPSITALSAVRLMHLILTHIQLKLQWLKTIVVAIVKPKRNNRRC